MGTVAPRELVGFLPERERLVGQSHNSVVVVDAPASQCERYMNVNATVIVVRSQEQKISTGQHQRQYKRVGDSHSQSQSQIQIQIRVSTSAVTGRAQWTPGCSYRLPTWSSGQVDWATMRSQPRVCGWINAYLEVCRIRLCTRLWHKISRSF